jgi:predicted ATPase
MSSFRNCFVITGPPGSGKTPVIEDLVAGGFGGVPEPARAVLAEQRAVDGQGTWDRNPQLFFDLMLERSLGDLLRHADAQRPVFFDRGLPDLIGYANLFGLDPTAAERAAAQHRYSDVVFVLPAWPEIYVNDDERRMSFPDAAAFGQQVRAIYQQLGYTLLEVPRATVTERASFVLRTVAELSRGARAEPAG